MSSFLKTVSYLFHPLLMPIVGSLIYFISAPRFIPNDVLFTKVFGLTIITIIIPVVLFFFLRTSGLIRPNKLAEAKDRKIPLLLQSLLFLLVLKMIIGVNEFPELYFFYLGILFSSLSAIFMALFNIRASIHLIGISAITTFTVVLSIHFGINLTLLIALLIIINGLIATSRLQKSTYSNIEVILGFLIGMIPQLTLVEFWL